MPVGFLATNVNTHLENGVWVVTLEAPSTEAHDLYLMFQRKQGSYSRQDIRFGWNHPYVEYCGQGWSWYGHMERVQLGAEGVRVTMDAEAAGHMHHDGVIEVGFDLSDGDYARLRSTIREIFHDVAYFEDGGTFSATTREKPHQ